MDKDSISINLEDTIVRTKQIMEESKAITMKNQQRKTMLEKKFMFNDLKAERDLSGFEEAEVVRKVSEIELRNHQESPSKHPEDSLLIEEMRTEIIELRQSLKEQSTYIQRLEKQVSELSIEKTQLFREIKLLQKEHEVEINRITLEGKVSKENSNIVERIAELERKYKEQIEANYELVEEIKELQEKKVKNLENERIGELELILIDSLKKYQGLNERLDKTESILALEKSNIFSTKNSTVKKVKITTPKSQKFKSGKKLLKNRSAYIKNANVNF